MQNLPQPTNHSPSALARVGFYFLAPIIGIVLLPFLLMFVVLFYLLAMVQGTRVFVFHFGQTTDNGDDELQRPHFLDIHAKPKALSDQSTPPTEN